MMYSSGGKMQPRKLIAMKIRIILKNFLNCFTRQNNLIHPQSTKLGRILQVLYKSRHKKMCVKEKIPRVI